MNYDYFNIRVDEYTKKCINDLIELKEKELIDIGGKECLERKIKEKTIKDLNDGFGISISIKISVSSIVEWAISELTKLQLEEIKQLYNRSINLNYKGNKNLGTLTPRCYLKNETIKSIEIYTILLDDNFNCKIKQSDVIKLAIYNLLLQY